MNQAAIDVLDEDELDAVLAHELYHLENQDWKTNLLAGVFSVLFGGKNSLLVFYNYPQIELDADDYAAEQVGVDVLKSALKKIDLQALRHRKTGKPPRYWNAVDEKLIEPWIAVYQLFFGTVLLDTARLSLEERENRL